MERNVTLGRIFGIEIGINWTWLIVVALVTWSLATAAFPDRNPGLGDGTYWAMAAVAALLFFVSILLHELGHALQARREGVEIEGITLWLFGGVATLKDLYRSSGAELRIAVAGPVVSAVIGAVLIAVGVLVPLPASVDGVVAWLGYINVLVLIFNLIPALPLDGGRILHAALWKVRDDLVWATRIGASIGRGFGLMLIVLGVGSLLFGSFAGALWLAFIGWFLTMAASAEQRQVLAGEALGELRVGDLAVADPVTVAADATLAEVMDGVVWETRHTAYPVIEDGRAVGLLPISRVAEVPREEWDRTSARDCALGLDEVVSLHPDRLVSDVLPELGDGGVDRALVVEHGRLVGLLSVTDLALAIETGNGRRRRPTRARRRETAQGA